MTGLPSNPPRDKLRSSTILNPCYLLQSTRRLFTFPCLCRHPSQSYDQDTTDMPAPNVPPRSRLRSVPPPKPTERCSSLYLLPVDPPLVYDDTPSLSSGSSSDTESLNPVRSPTSDTVVVGRISRGVGRDPYKIRDGADSKRSTSGVYTRTSYVPLGSVCKSSRLASSYFPRTRRSTIESFPDPRILTFRLHPPSHCPPTYT